MFDFLNNIPSDMKFMLIGFISGMVVNIIVSFIYKKLNFPLVASKLESIGLKLGRMISFFLRTRLGKKAEDLIEALLIDIKILVDVLTTSIVLGLRKDNDEKETYKEIKNREKQILGK